MNKYIIPVLIMPISAFCAEERITVGMDISKARAIIKSHGGKDMWNQVAVSGKPKMGVFWLLEKYDDVIITIDESNGKLSKIYYSKKPEVPKLPSARDYISVVEIILDRKKKSIDVKEPKPTSRKSQ